MPKTLIDFELEPPPWLIEDWLPMGHRAMDTAPEGSFKTILGCWLAVSIASGSPVFGHPVLQGNVLMVDEETPETSLDYHLKRFSLGLGFRYKDLPIYRLSMNGFRFGRKAELDKLLNIIKNIEPVFIRLDSLLAMLPGGRQSTSENDCHLGETIRDDLNQILSPKLSLLLAAHSKKFVSELSLDDILQYAMQTIVRGHGSIVGEGCDTGYIIKKLSEHPKPTRFCIVTKVRRQAIQSSKIKYIEMKEQSYGEGWARLEEIPPEKLPPSETAIEIFPLFKIADGRGNYNHSSQWILRTMAFQSKRYCRNGIEELLRRKIIVRVAPQNYEINQKRGSQCDSDYLRMLEGTP